MLPWVVAITMTGCQSVAPRAPISTLESKVSYQAVAEESRYRYRLRNSESVIGPSMTRGNVAPVYPPAMASAGQPPVVIDALLIVGADGEVHEVRIPASSAKGRRSPFARSVAIATLEWRFTPLRIAVWKEQPGGGTRRVGTRSKPFSQRYRFHFRIVDGKPQVAVGGEGQQANGSARP